MVIPIFLGITGLHNYWEFSKNFEKLTYKRIKPFLNKHNILYKHQLGFQNQFFYYSQALVDVSDYIHTALDEGNRNLYRPTKGLWYGQSYHPHTKTLTLWYKKYSTKLVRVLVEKQITIHIRKWYNFHFKANKWLWSSARIGLRTIIISIIYEW